MSRFKLIIICLLLVAGTFWYFHNTGSGENKSGKGAGKSGGPVPVSVATAKKGDIEIYLNGLGNITPPSTATVHTRVDGQLMRILFREGQYVREGDLLAELDARPFEAQLEQAEGQLMRDTALLEDARINLQRYKILFKEDSIAKQQLDTQMSLVKQYEGAVTNDKGLVDNAKLQIIYTKITAPFGGRVGLRQVDLGNIVHASDASGVVVITQLQPITAIFTLPEDDIPQVNGRMQSNGKIVAEAWDRDNKNRITTGTVIAIDNQVDPTTGTVKLRAEFENKDNALFPSQFVNIRCHVDTKKDVILVPVSAIQHGSPGSFVYLVKSDNTVTVRPVKIDVSEGEKVAIAGGLNEGDVVVTDGSDNLREGAKITIPEKSPQAGAPPSLQETSKPAAPGEDSRQHKHKKK